MDTAAASRGEEDVYPVWLSCLWCRERCSWLYLCRMDRNVVVGIFHICVCSMG